MPSLPFPLRSNPAAPVFQIGARYAQPAHDDACCAPSPKAAVAEPARKPARATLADLDLHLHCSIVGTCLTTTELRKLVPRHAPLIDRKTASDLEIHHAAVELCCDGGAGRKEINKALDTRHALAIRQFKAAADTGALRTLWTAALASGEVPGAYWALMTHPLVTSDLRALAFGDVHMLSHLVGASNRADIRRLVALENTCAELKEQNERQQARLHEQHLRHAQTQRAMTAQIADLQARAAGAPADAASDVEHLRAALAERDARLALHIARCAEAERKAETNANLVRALALRVEQAEEAAELARDDAAAMEQALGRALDPAADAAALPSLHGRRIAYVGGRPGATAVLAELVRGAGGELLIHDGGMEDRKGTLAALLPRADMVVFPVDCISHNAMDLVKRICGQAGIDYHPLRSSSVASCIVLLQRPHAPAARVSEAPRSRFCLRHG